MKLGVQNESAIRALDGGGYIANDLISLASVVSTGFNKEHDAETNQHGTILALGSISERKRTLAMGDWADIPYGSVAFTASGTMTWTVPAASQLRFRSMLIGHTLFLGFTFSATSVSAPLSTALILPLPTGMVGHGTLQETPYIYSDNGTLGTGIAQILAGANHVNLLTATAGNWSASVGASSVVGNLAIEIQ